MQINNEESLPSSSILTKAIKKRFKSTFFDIKCFSSVGEIETKVLVDEDYIIFTDKMYEKEECHDYFLIQKRKSDKVIRFRDVIDHLVNIDFSHSDKSLLDIRLSPVKVRNDNSVPVFYAVWSE
jgi:hypothetical protein